MPAPTCYIKVTTLKDGRFTDVLNTFLLERDAEAFYYETERKVDDDNDPTCIVTSPRSTKDYVIYVHNSDGEIDIYHFDSKVATKFFISGVLEGSDQDIRISHNGVEVDILSEGDDDIYASIYNSEQ